MRRPGRPVGRRAAVAAVLLAPALAAATTPPLVAVGPVAGAHPALVRQLRQALCAAVECVPWGTVSDPRGLDLARAQEAELDGALTGRVEGPGARRLVILSLAGARAEHMGRWRLALRPDGTIMPSALRGFVRDLEARVAAAAGRARLAPPPPGAHARAPPPPAPPAPTAPVATAPEPGASDRDLDRDLELPPMRLGAPPAPAARAPWLAVEASARGGRRELSYQGAARSPAPLRGHRVPALVAPGLRIELQPGAWFTRGALAGLSLHGSFAEAIGVETRVNGVAHPGRMSWLSAGVAWRRGAAGAPRRGFSAALSWERREVTSRPAIPGLPDRRLSGAKASVGFAQPLGPVSILADAGYVHWLEAPELVAGPRRLFPGGRAFGLDAEAGLALRVAAGWSLGLAVEYATIRYRLERHPEGLYEARTARDDQLTTRLAVRLEL